MTTSSQPAAELRPLNAQLPTAQYLTEMWARREFVIAQSVEEMRASHRDTLLGNAWNVLNPLLQAAMYYFIFAMILGVDRGVRNFPLWLMIGVFAFGLTRGTVQGGARSISSNQGLMRALRFPRALLPVSVVVDRLLTFGFQLCVIVVVTLATGEGVSRRWLVLPLVIAVHSALNLGCAFFAARLNAVYRDVQQLIPFFFRMLFFVSGVIFPLDVRLRGRDIPPTIQTILDLNPLIALLDCYRWIFMSWPVALDDLIRLLVTACVVLTSGFWFFRAAELRYSRT